MFQTLHQDSGMFTGTLVAVLFFARMLWSECVLLLWLKVATPLWSFLYGRAERIDLRRRIRKIWGTPARSLEHFHHKLHYTYFSTDEKGPHFVRTARVTEQTFKTLLHQPWPLSLWPLLASWAGEIWRHATLVAGAKVTGTGRPDVQWILGAFRTVEHVGTMYRHRLRLWSFRWGKRNRPYLEKLYRKDRWIDRPSPSLPRPFLMAWSHAQ